LRVEVEAAELMVFHRNICINEFIPDLKKKNCYNHDRGVLDATLCDKICQ